MGSRSLMESGNYKQKKLRKKGIKVVRKWKISRYHLKKRDHQKEQTNRARKERNERQKKAKNISHLSVGD
jgi:hypothetical protein